MKKTISLFAALIGSGLAMAQSPADSSRTSPDFVPPGLKSFNRVLPRWSLDLSYRTGWLMQSPELVDLRQAYAPGSQPTSAYDQTPEFSGGRGNGGDIQVNYFFNRERTLGFGTGINFMHYTGTLTMAALHADYQALDARTGQAYRQIIRSNSPLQENIRTTTLSIPVLFKVKHQFGSVVNPGRFGISAAAGPVIGFHNQTRSDASGTFSYEAIYRLNGDRTATVSGFDSSFINDRNGVPQPGDTRSSLVMTEANYNGDGLAAQHLDLLSRADNGYNVGLNKGLAPSQREQTSDIRRLSLGAMVQGGASYQISDHVTFHADAYYAYQHWQGKDNASYKPTTGVREEGGTYYANYNALTKGIRKTEYHSYGISAGLRIFFGERRDIDGDGISDKSDLCPLSYGIAKFRGCADSDNDGSPDSEDGCPYEFGPETTSGCPDGDGDGVPDKDDICQDQYGVLRNGCPVSTLAEYAPVASDLTKENGERLPPQIVLDNDKLHFAFRSSVISDSAAKILDYALRVLNDNPKIVIHLSGYTDDIGSELANLLLSSERAKSSRAYLMRAGISEKRIIISGNGKDKPLMPNSSDENRGKNRRIEMKLLLPL